MIKYLHGDATKPQSETEIITIAHVCNDANKFGSGFAAAIEKAYPGVRQEYINRAPHRLGDVYDILVGETEYQSLYVAHMVAQIDPYPRDGSCKLQYHALETCLNHLKSTWDFYTSKNTTHSIHMPKIGAGLAGGDWNKIEKVIDTVLEGLPVFVYLWED